MTCSSPKPVRLERETYGDAFVATTAPMGRAMTPPTFPMFANFCNPQQVSTRKTGPISSARCHSCYSLRSWRNSPPHRHSPFLPTVALPSHGTRSCCFATTPPTRHYRHPLAAFERYHRPRLHCRRDGRWACSLISPSSCCSEAVAAAPCWQGLLFASSVTLRSPLGSLSASRPLAWMASGREG